MTDEMINLKAQVATLSQLVTEMNARILQYEFERRLAVEVAAAKEAAAKSAAQTVLDADKSPK